MVAISPQKYNPLTMVAPTAPKKLPAKKKIDFSLIAPKTDQLATQKIITKQVAEKRASANALLPQVNKIAETTGKIGQANVAKKQEEANKILGGMTNTVNQGFTQAKDTSLKDYYTTVQQNPDATEDDIMNAFPEFKGKESVLKDYYVTLSENPDASEEEIRAAFPEIYDLPKVKTKQPKGRDISINKDPIGDVKNAVGGLYRSVVDLPQSIIETGILDNPAEDVARGPVGDAIRSGTKSLFGEEAVKQYQTQQQGKKFSDVAKDMTIGDTNSDLYNQGRVAGNVLQYINIANQGVQLAKGIAKKGATKNILNVIKEGNSAANKRIAVTQGRLTPEVSQGFFRSGRESIVKPTQKTLDARDTIVKIIDSPSKDPSKLYTQLSTKIGELGSNLQSQLKNINIGNINMRDINDPLLELADEMTDISVTLGKRLKILTKDIGKSKNADEFWESLKKLDAMIPENIKAGDNLDSKGQIIYNAWRKARGLGNDKLDELANAVSDAQVKKQFKDMSNLFHAQGNIKSRGAENNLISKVIPSTIKRIGKNTASTAATIGGGALAYKLLGG